MEQLRFEPDWQRRWSLDDYHRLIDLGFFAEDEHAELLEGYIVALSPQTPAHARIIAMLTGTCSRAAPAIEDVRVQLPLTLARSEPEPDLAVVDESLRQCSRHPTSARLVVEVSGTESLRKDSAFKAALYAEAAILEYWIVDIQHERVRVYRDPDPLAREYRSQRIVDKEDVLHPLALPSVEVSVARLFAK